MIALIVVFSFAMFAQDNAEFIQDVNDKRELDCTFTYVGKQDIRPEVPHIGVDNKYIYFSMEPCNRGD